MADIKFAVLIDAENVPYAHLKEMMAEISKYGTVTIKRAYTDWTKPQASGWKTAILEHAITPIQQYSYTAGKNASDSALIIDSMDILYAGKVDGFCIISSDSDFTRLATRLRESAMTVIGLGEKKTPKSFVVSCDKFIYLDILKPASVSTKTTVKAAAKSRPVQEPPVGKVDAETSKLIMSSVNDLDDGNGWVSLQQLGSLLSRNNTDFDARNYGFSKLSQLIKSLDRFEVEQRSEGMYLKLKRGAAEKG